MESNFKESYIKEQREQAAARKARLAKIGMAADTAQKVSTNAPSNANAATEQPARGVRPVPVRGTNRATYPAQGKYPTPKNTTAGAASPARPARNMQNGSADMRRETTAVPRTQRNTQGSSINRPHNQYGTYRPQMYTAGGARYEAPKGTARSQSAAAPASAQQPAYTNKRNDPRPGRPSQAAPQQRRPRLDDTDSHIFKKNLSESESRAMMFALTGEAKAPDDGGDVDVIDIGRNRVSSRNDVLRTNGGKKKRKVGTYIGRSFFVLLTAVIMAVVFVYTALLTVAYGPSETVRNLLVNSAMQASATKWVPYLVLSKDKVASILADSEKVVEDVVSIDDYGESDKAITEDEWANAQDGMIFETVNGTTYKAYVLLVKDPTRVFVGTSTDNFANATAGVNIFQAADRYGAVACINGGEFLDNGGHGSGYAPLGLTYSLGKCVFDDGSRKTFMGFTNDNKLIVKEGMTQKEANELGVRDAVSFQTGNTLIERDGDDLKFYYQDGNTGTSQRTAIGQREDGTVVLIVTDGRTASSLGATHNDMIDMMVSYGAVSAGMLDGGSSAMMFYRDYYDKYDVDKSTLDQYQLQGLVNNYKAFTNPRRIPTFFMVKPEA